ncbi:MAG TPA: redoxin domain-containing protein [Candidatus Binataceae bacterium]
MLKPGDTAPPFDLPCATGGRIGRIALEDIRTDLILLFFYPRDFSFICPTEVTGFNDAREDCAAEKTAILGISVDDADSHRRWSAELGGIGYPLLADLDGKVARAYGVFDEAEKVAQRATFILDEQRKIAFAAACPINVGRSVSETLRIVRALRTGQMCPADWTPGVPFGPAGTKY